jgi:DNA-binding winged helix-turn-helix (wHTH) protein
MHMRFGECTFDAVRREVRCGSEPAHLSPRAFELLRVLIESRPRAVAKEELLARLWPDRFASEASLAGLAAEIRRQIRDDAREPRFLRTVHGFGYAFCEAAPESDVGGVFRLLWGLGESPLLEGENVIGRDPDATVSIDHATVSRHHARIAVYGGTAILEDLASKNGTWLRGRRITSPEPLADADELRVGSVPILVRHYPAEQPTKTQF